MAQKTVFLDICGGPGAFSQFLITQVGSPEHAAVIEIIVIVFLPSLLAWHDLLYRVWALLAPRAPVVLHTTRHRY